MAVTVLANISMHMVQLAHQIRRFEGGCELLVGILHLSRCPPPQVSTSQSNQLFYLDFNLTVLGGCKGRCRLMLGAGQYTPPSNPCPSRLCLQGFTMLCYKTENVYSGLKSVFSICIFLLTIKIYCFSTFQHGIKRS